MMMLLTLLFLSATSGAQPHMCSGEYFIRCFQQILQDGRVRRLTSYADKHTRAVQETLHAVYLEGKTRETSLNYFNTRIVWILQVIS